MKRHYFRILWDLIGILALGSSFFTSTWKTSTLILLVWVCIYFLTCKLTYMQYFFVVIIIPFSLCCAYNIFDIVNQVEYFGLFFLLTALFLLYLLRKALGDCSILVLCTQFVVIGYFIIHVIFPFVNISDVYLIAPIIGFLIRDLVLIRKVT